MSDLVIIHRAFAATEASEPVFQMDDSEHCLMWQTCRRQIFFFDGPDFLPPHLPESYEVYTNLDAEEFLVQVLCGLKSPLLGETEVFGQFKSWWEQPQGQKFKARYSGRVQAIYSAVKRIREESLCGLGSQSYGSLLRKKLSELNFQSFDEPHSPAVQVDFIGAGQLVTEIIPWIQKKFSYRVWCRNPEKVRSRFPHLVRDAVLPMTEPKPLGPVLVVAAPLNHGELNGFIRASTSKTQDIILFDLRHDSMSDLNHAVFHRAFSLDYFSNSVEEKKTELSLHIEKAYRQIAGWKSAEKSRIQVRPFGWDDL